MWIQHHVFNTWQMRTLINIMIIGFTLDTDVDNSAAVYTKTRVVNTMLFLC